MHVSAKYTKEVLEPVVRESKSYAQVIRKFGLKQTGGSQANFARLVKVYEIDISHFLGQRSNQGGAHLGGPEKLHWSSILVLDRHGRKERASRLREAMIEAGIPHVCAVCGGKPEWLGELLVLEIDHKNGNTLDNRKRNVRFLCPNCHSQTENYGKRGCGGMVYTYA
jgi:hypothetical protein